MRTGSYRTARSMTIALLAAFIGGLGHAATMGQALQQEVVALMGVLTALTLAVLPQRRLGPAAIAAVMGCNQLLVHNVCMWRMHAHAPDPHALHVHAQMDVSITRMLLVHAVAMLVGTLLLLRVESLLLRWATRAIVAVIERVRSAGRVPEATRRPLRSVAAWTWNQQRSWREDQWSRTVTGRRGPPCMQAFSA